MIVYSTAIDKMWQILNMLPVEFAFWHIRELTGNVIDGASINTNASFLSGQSCFPFASSYCNKTMNSTVLLQDTGEKLSRMNSSTLQSKFVLQKENWIQTCCTPLEYTSHTQLMFPWIYNTLLIFDCNFHRDLGQYSIICNWQINLTIMLL